jgi:glycosyltransferase involved in cell wall biosynthesis
VKKEKRVLIVAAEFPPFKTIGRIRTIKLCQHLPQFGWEPIVLTVNESATGPYDRTTLHEIPNGVPVYRAYRFEPEKEIIHILKRILGRNSDRPSNVSRDMTSAATQSHNREKGIAALLSRFKLVIDQFTYRNLLIPDDLVLWTLSAVMRGRRVCREHAIDLLYRDLWTGDVLRDWVPQWRRRLEIALECRTLSKADAIVAVSEPKTAFLRDRLSHLPQDKFYTVTNGYDTEEYEGLEKSYVGNNVVRFVYTGRLFKNRRGYELITAAGSLFRDRPELKDRFQVEYYGGVSPEIQARLDHLLSEYALTARVKFFPDVPYSRAKQIQVDASVLLLIVDTGETTSGVIPGKLFEYIGAGRPILCIAAPGATSEIIQEGRLGWVTAPNDVNALRNILEELLSRRRNPRFNPNIGYLSQFERKQLVGRFAQTFDRILVSL